MGLFPFDPIPVPLTTPHIHTTSHPPHHATVLPHISTRPVVYAIVPRPTITLPSTQPAPTSRVIMDDDQPGLVRLQVIEHAGVHYHGTV